MGYDMYVRAIERPPYQTADGELNGDAWAPQYYLRRSIGGIAALREALVEVGAAFDNYPFENSWLDFALALAPADEQAPIAAEIERQREESVVPPFPPHPGDEHFEWDQEQGRVVPTTPEGYAHEREVDRVKRWRPERPGIPIHKLSDNSGWIVTPDECREALEAIRRYAIDHDGQLPEPGDDVSEWDDTIPFLQSAADHDGFEVR